MGNGVAVSRTADVGVARQALAVCREVAALGLLKPDHVRSVTLYGGDVEIRPVAPGVLLSRVMERSPDVEAHNPDLMFVHSEFPRGSPTTVPPIVAGESGPVFVALQSGKAQVGKSLERREDGQGPKKPVSWARRLHKRMEPDAGGGDGEECLRHRRLQPRLQDDRGRRPGGEGAPGRAAGTFGPFPLLPLRNRRTAPHEPLTLPMELTRGSPEHRVDRPRIESAVREILIAIGEDPEREGLRGTPRRIADAYAFLFAGLADDPARHLDVGFQEEHREMVLVRDIPLHSLCEHHLMPFVGKAHVGYIPDGKVVGLSKLARLVEGYARRPQLQERLTTQIADALHHELGTLGAIVVIEANHLCMSIRGIQKPGSMAVTSAVRGTYAKDERTRQEAMSLITAQR